MIRIVLFLLLLVSVNAGAAVNVIFRGDFETGTMKTPATAGVVDSFYVGGSTLPDANGNCIAGGNNITQFPATKVVTDIVKDGAFANKQTLFWECDYRPVNGGTYQKPRSAVSALHENALMSVGRTYWFTFSFYLPTDWVSDKSDRPTNLWQSHKSQSRTAPSKLDVEEAAGTLRLKVADVDGSTASNQVFSWPTTTGEWHTVMVNYKPCFSGADACGFTKVYLSNTARRLAGTEKTAVWTDVGPNMEYATTTVSMTANIYKYNWHCVQIGNVPAYSGSFSDARLDYNWCMQEPPPSQTLTYNSGLGKALPITVYFDEIMLATAADSDDINAAIPVIMPTYSDGVVAPTVPQIERVNGDNPLDPSDYNYFTTNTTAVGSWGVYDVELTDGITTAKAEGWLSNATGGCVALNDIPTLSGGPITVNMKRDSPEFHSSRGGADDTTVANWTKFNINDPVAYSTTDTCFGFTGGATISNFGAAAGLANMPAGDAVSIAAADKVVGSFAIEGGSTSLVRLRIDCGLGDAEVQGTLGSLPSTPTTNTAGADDGTVTERLSRGVRFVDIAFTGDAADTCVLKAGPNVATLNASINLLNAQLWKDRTPTIMSYATSLNKPDVTAPTLSDCSIGWNSETALATAGCSASEPLTLHVVITDSATAPALTQVEAGQNNSGTAALWAGTVATTSTSASLTTTALNPYVNKYAYFSARDLANNQVSGSTAIAAENFITAEPLIVKKIKFASGTTRLRKTDGTLFTGQLSHFLLLGSDPREPGPKTELVKIINPDIFAGFVDFDETDTVCNGCAGSINALDAGQYWFTAKSLDGTLKAVSQINVVVE